MSDSLPARWPDAIQLGSILATALSSRRAVDDGDSLPEASALEHLRWHEREVLHYHELVDQGGGVGWWRVLRRRQGTIDHLLVALLRFAMNEVQRAERSLLKPRQFARTARDRFTAELSAAEETLPARGRLRLPAWWGQQRRFERHFAAALAAYAEALLSLHRELPEPILSEEQTAVIAWHAQEVGVTRCRPWSPFNHYARVTIAESLPLLSALSALRLSPSA